MADEWRRQAEDAAEQGVDSAVKVVRRGREAAEDVQKTAENLACAIANGASKYEELFFSKVKEGIYWTMENKEITTAVGGTALLVGIPATRSMLMNLLVRRFRSEESLFRSAERKAGRLKEGLELQEKEYKKLEERAVLAAEEMKRGMGKLTAAGSQLKKLGSEASNMENKYADLLQELRRIPGSQSIALRGQVAESASSVKKQRQGIERHVNQIVKQGIDI